MAVVANCRQPDSDYVSVDRVPLPISQRFPVPSSVRGFCIEPEDSVEYPVLGLPIPPGFLQGALSPEGSYLELTIGQIWPR